MPLVAVLLAAMVMGAACTGEPPPPKLVAVEPQSIEAGRDAAVSIVGRNLRPAITGNLVHPDEAVVNADFALTIVAGERSIALTDVRIVSHRELSAVVPAVTAVGVYDLMLVDPRGVGASLSNAIEVREPDETVVGPPCADESECAGDPCATDGLCRAGHCVYDKDADGDAYVDSACGGSDCADRPGNDPACNDLDGALCNPARDGFDTCDGADNDCDGSVDEDYVVDSSCGVGWCETTSTPSSCAGGAETACQPGAPAEATDLTCDGIDGDCDGSVDEDYVIDSSCGVGWCETTSTPSSCAGGAETACQSGAPTEATDVTCDGIDGDCDGPVDEDYVAEFSCGAGWCETTSTSSSCVGGAETACQPGTPAETTDVTCDGIDGDCDGPVDEDYVIDSSCGVGWCETTSTSSSCVGGAETACQPGTPAEATDVTCDGIDGDCDGPVDEDYVVESSCGVGWCETTSTSSSCVGGAETACQPGTPAEATDVTCDGIDGDCDGPVDEDPETVWYADNDSDTYGDPLATAIACSSPAGYVADNNDCDDDTGVCGADCFPGNPELCDGHDNDCDTVPDNPAGGCGLTYDAEITLGSASLDSVADLGIDSNGNIYATGTFYDTTELGGGERTSDGFSDVFLVSYDPAGAYRWDHVFGGQYYDGGNAVAVNGITGDVFLTGVYDDDDVDFGGGDLTNAGDYDIVLSAYQNSSTYRWQIGMGGSTADIGNDLTVDSAGNLYLCGEFHGTVDFGVSLVAEGGGSDAIIASYDADGSFLWAEDHGHTSTNDDCSAIAVDDAGSVYVTGIHTSAVSFGGSLLSIYGGWDVVVASYDAATGSHNWSRGVGSSGNDVPYGIAAKSDRVCITGMTRGTASFGGSSLPFGGDIDVYVACYAANDGAHLWSKTFGGAGGEYGTGIILDDSSNLYITGSFDAEIDLGGGTLTSDAGSTDFFIAHFSSSGDHLWSERYGGPGGDRANAMVLAPAGVLYVGGTYSDTVDFGGGPTTATGSDGFILRLTP